MIHRRFRSNLQFKVLGETIARFSSFALYAVGARLLGIENFGLFSLAFSYAIIFTIFIDLGTNNIVTRHIARNRDTLSDIIPTTILFKLSLIPIVLGLLFGFVSIVSDDSTLIRLTTIFGIFAVGVAMGEHLSAVLSGLERMDVEANLKMVWKLGGFILAVVFYQHFKTVESFVWGLGVGQWLGVIVGIIWIRFRVMAGRAKFNKALLLDLLKTSFPLFVAWVFLIIYENQDIIILSFLKFTNSDIGLFSASAKLVDALKPLPVLLMGALFPILSEKAIKDRSLFSKMSVIMYQYAFYLLAPAVFIVSLYATPICQLIFGQPFAPSGSVFQVAIWGFMFIFINHLLIQSLISSDLQKRYLHGAIMVFLINGTLCVILFRSMGIQGGAWALLGGEFFYLLFNLLGINSDTEER